MECKNCESGYQYAPIGEHFVTADMAMDAGMPEIAGASMGVEWDYVICDCCNGDFEDCDTCRENIDVNEA
jgi:hypothetical protein